MGQFSLEPPRRDLHLHHDYDAIEPELDRVLDVGPQGNDGSIVGTVETGVPGIDGSGVRVEEGTDDYVSINDLIGTVNTFSMSTWVELEHPVDPATDNVSATIELGGSNTTVEWEFPSTFEGWHFFAVTYDRNRIRIFHGTDTEKTSLVASGSGSGQVTNDFTLEVEINNSAIIDDTRVYTTHLSPDQVEDLRTLAAEPSTTDSLEETWPTPGMPFVRGAGNERLASALGEETGDMLRTLDSIIESRRIDEAAGPQLDEIGALAGVNRRSGEQDGPYRARIKATVIAGRSGGTFDDLLDAVSAILNVDERRIEIERDDASIATAEITVRTADLDAASITKSDLIDAAEDMVLAGHDVTITETSEFAFTLIQDGDANDASLGLTSDSISTGGELVSDV